MNKELTHFPRQHFAAEGRNLVAGGRAVSDLYREAGGRPLFVYDTGVVKQNIQALGRALPDRIQVTYALKANPCRALLEKIAPWLAGVDVASSAELLQCLNTGVTADRISFAGPGKTERELAVAIDKQVLINVESKTELTRCADLGAKLGKRPTVCLRVNPMIEVRGSGMKMSGVSSPFGIDASQVAGILTDFPHDRVGFKGFHVYACSQILNADSLVGYYGKVFRLLDGFRQYLAEPIRLLNLGGGFGIPYFPGEQPLDITRVGRELDGLINSYPELLEEAVLKMEFGRYLVGNAGLYVAQVQDIKRSGEDTYAVVNGGMHHHLANSGNLGQVLRRNYDVAVANRMDAEPAGRVNIVGPLCTPLDVVAHQVMVPALEIGDLIAVFNSGAYALSASPTGFLSHPQPAEIVL